MTPGILVGILIVGLCIAFGGKNTFKNSGGSNGGSGRSGGGGSSSGPTGGGE